MNKLAWWLVGLLGVEFGLGMMAAMYKAVPADAPTQLFGHIGYRGLSYTNQST